MNTIIKGRDFSQWKTTGIVFGQCKNENRDGVKSNYVIFTIEDMDGGKPKHYFEFEENVFPGACSILKNYRMLKDDNTPLTDQKGGFIVNLEALKASADAERFSSKLIWNGGLMEWYPFSKGMCYANDRDGKPVKYKDETPVTADGVNIFVQVKMYIVNKDGEMIPSYLPGMGPHDVGPRIERQFWKNAVNAAPVVQMQQGNNPGGATGNAGASGAGAAGNAGNGDPF